MAMRVAFSKVLQRSNLAKPLLCKVSPMILRSQPKSQIAPSNAMFETPSMFSLETIKKQKEVLPMVAICGIGLLLEIIYLIRLALTRDDVRYWSSMNCDYVEMREGVPPRRRKMLIINQKFETPPGLINALREPTEEELAEMEAARRGGRIPRRCAIFCDSDAQKPPKKKAPAAAE